METRDEQDEVTGTETEGGGDEGEGEAVSTIYLLEVVVVLLVVRHGDEEMIKRGRKV